MLSGGNLGFDSHCHLHFEHFDKDLEQVLKKSRDAGISHILIPSTDIETSLRSAEIAERYGLFAAAAFHPEHLPPEDTAKSSWHSLRGILLRPSVIAIGETGLDFHHKTFSVEKQIFWFQKHIELAEAIGYPLIVHSRGAELEVLEQLPEKLSVPVILHCWGGNEALTDVAVARDYYLGVDGPLTYRKNSKLRNIIARVPRNRLLAETDSPFLPPEPYRGRRNEPAHLRYVILQIRELWGSNISIENTSFTLWENAMRAYMIHPDNRRADIVYRYCDSLYVNITSRCQNNCGFCVRRSEDGLSDYFLRHAEDPSDELVLSTLGAMSLEDFSELVFCGFGEPTLRSELLMKAASAASSRGIRTRLNTNGLCASILSDQQVLELVRCFDSVSISLNASGAREYSRICSSEVEAPWDCLMKFIRLAKVTGVRLQVSVVENSGVDVTRVKALSERLKIPLRIR